jgi:aldehyde dehydrogenase (NAD+)
MTERYTNVIDGKRVEAVGGGSYDDLNPASRAEPIGAFPRSDYRDVDRAVEVARTVRQAWRDVPAPDRASRLLRAADLLRADQDAYVRLITWETGKVQREAQAELRDTLEALVAFAGEGMRSAPAGPSGDARERLAFSLRIPVGVVGVIASWCHPLEGIVRQVAPALAAGCPVVLKPSEDAPLIATRFAELLIEAGIPPAALGVVHGTGEEAGAPLVRHPDVALVSVSGSLAVGREVAITCAAEQKPVLLDLGGRSATIVMDDAEMDAALEGALEGALATSGQGRAPATRLLVHRKIHREFAERLVARVQALRVGDGMSPEVDLGPLINDGRLKRAHAFTRLAQKEGAKLLGGGEALREGELRKGFFYAPTVLAELSPAMRVARDLAYGPIVALLAIGGMDEALEIAERIGVGVGLALYTQRLDPACRAVDRTAVPSVTVNAPICAGASGPSASWFRGGEAGGASLGAYGQWRTVVLRPGRGGRRGAAETSAAAGGGSGDRERTRT